MADAVAGELLEVSRADVHQQRRAGAGLADRVDPGDEGSGVGEAVVEDHCVRSAGQLAARAQVDDRREGIGVGGGRKRDGERDDRERQGAGHGGSLRVESGNALERGVGAGDAACRRAPASARRWGRLHANVVRI